MPSQVSALTVPYSAGATAPDAATADVEDPNPAPSLLAVLISETSVHEEPFQDSTLSRCDGGGPQPGHAEGRRAHQRPRPQSRNIRQGI